MAFRDKVIIARYTEAFVRYALPRTGLDGLLSDMKTARFFLRECPELLEFLSAPIIPAVQRNDFVDRVLGRVVSATTTDFIRFLILKKRIELLPGIAERVRIVYARGDIADVTVRSTFPLELEVVQQIKDELAKRLGKAVNLYLEFDAALLGGLQIRIGNLILDGTVRGRMNDLKNQLLKVRVGQ